MKGRLSPDDIESLITASIRSSLARKFSKIGVPVVFCMTKFDTLGLLDGDNAELVKLAHDRIKQIFSYFFEENHRHPVMITGTSLGQNIDPGPISDHNRKGGEFDPFCIVAPFDFCLSFGTLSASRYHEGERKGHEVQMARARAREIGARYNGILDNFIGWFEADAEIFEMPEGAWKRRANNAENSANFQGIRERSFQYIANTSIHAFNKSSTKDVNFIYFGGGKHEFDLDSGEGVLPLRPS
ncbi:hypothetical protein [Asticcacaulis sp. EMRT-3]|uniref:hypothetical protein n=1 Tax=Asticcacaulis sp. EMRT-3 TaxID=3040349 RepID=UPI0024AE9719|nr:hypothetical protein [Asticcacaulis sp. EMRT-3]MDI7774689.1 hypothetical protein [Asticcacaulis sp. EMRT-3]